MELEFLEFLFKAMLIICFVFPFWAVWHGRKKKREEEAYAQQEAKAKRDRIDKLTQDATRALSSISNATNIDTFYSDLDAFNSAMSELKSMGISLSSSIQQKALSLSDNGAYHDELLCKCIDRGYSRAVDLCRSYSSSARNDHMSAFFDHLKRYSRRYSPEVAKHVKSLESESFIPVSSVESVQHAPRVVTILPGLGELPHYAQYKTQNPSLSYEAAKLVDAEFSICFLQHIQEEIERESKGLASSHRYRVPRDLVQLRTLPPDSLSFAPVIAFPDLGFLSDAEYLYIYLASQLVGKPDDPTIRYGLNGITQSFFPDLPRAIALLRNLNFFEENSPDTRKFLITVKDMRDLAKENNLSPSSKLRREELEAFLFEHLPYEVIEKNTRFCFTLSPLGETLVDSLYTDARILPPPMRFPNFSNDDPVDDDGEMIVFDDLE